MWEVNLHPAFDPEYDELGEDVREVLLAQMTLLEQFGPKLGRPRVDTLNGSKHANMKEIRFDAEGGVWRFAFAFDTKREAVVLCGGDKSGVSQSRFYRKLIDKADQRFDAHLAQLEKAQAKTIEKDKKGKNP